MYTLKKLYNIKKEEGIKSALNRGVASAKLDLEEKIEDTFINIIGGAAMAVFIPYFVYKDVSKQLKQQKIKSQLK